MVAPATRRDEGRACGVSHDIRDSVQGGASFGGAEAVRGVEKGDRSDEKSETPRWSAWNRGQLEKMIRWTERRVEEAVPRMEREAEMQGGECAHIRSCEVLIESGNLSCDEGGLVFLPVIF